MIIEKTGCSYLRTCVPIYDSLRYINIILSETKSWYMIQCIYCVILDRAAFFSADMFVSSREFRLRLPAAALFVGEKAVKFRKKCGGREVLKTHTIL